MKEDGYPMLVNYGWDAARSTLSSYTRGRGLGDCGGAETYVWDGSPFRLVEARSMGECRGAMKWITTWRANVTEALGGCKVRNPTQVGAFDFASARRRQHMPSTSGNLPIGIQPPALQKQTAPRGAIFLAFILWWFWPPPT